MIKQVQWEANLPDCNNDCFFDVLPLSLVASYQSLEEPAAFIFRHLPWQRNLYGVTSQKTVLSTVMMRTSYSSTQLSWYLSS